MRKPNLTVRSERSEDPVGARRFLLVHLTGAILSHGTAEVCFTGEDEARRFAERHLCDAPAWRCTEAPAPAAAAA